MDMKTNIPETVSAGETLTDVQICPPGEWPNGKTVQHCDLDAFARIVRDWEAGGSKPVLCDFEHRSEDPSPTSDTRAAAWISDLGIGPDGSLVGNFTFTDEGAKAVSGRALRFLSPVFVPDASGAIVRLRSVALTNRPNIPVAPLLNKEPQPVEPNVEATETKGPEMDKLKELLGLAPEATDEDVLAAVTALADKVAQLSKEKEDAEAESFAEEHKALCNKEALKAAYLLNKDAARGLVSGIVRPEPARRQVLLNKEAQAPAPQNRFADARAEMASLPPAERAAFYASHKADIDK